MAGESSAGRLPKRTSVHCRLQERVPADSNRRAGSGRKRRAMPRLKEEEGGRY